MKKLMITVALLALSAGAANATDQNINITATVAGYCGIDGTNSGTTPTVTSVPLTVTDGAVSAAVQTAGPYAVICNKAADVKLTSGNGALTSGLTAVSGFDNIINYSASVSGLSLTPSVSGSTATTAGAAGSEQLGSTGVTGGAATGNVSVSITPVAANPLLAGSYADTLTLSVTPQ